MKDLLIEYRKTRLCVLNKIKSLKYKVDEEDKLSIYKDILKDIDYTIEWLTCGHEPGNYNAIDRSQCYLVDNDVINKAFSESMYKKNSDVEYNDIINDVNNKVSYALMKLTPKELECFIMVKCEGLSLKQTADLLKINKSTVNGYLTRVSKKIKRELINNLFVNLQ
ncbi:TPA: RNA polymerase subunit sigma-70 [Staphylococcus aureus]|uniref:sigma factor-like helix-turn-helix DNA-binding protein n=1 Tax=Staphylococcus aureus TaxID=1280 RepID=UPI000ADA65CA|nr:sigma factor-like helix-turn-helix DNA-binding protein [Staphylococcus aureus]MBO8799543.1 RNA polymerase subunit sigma-70 [Staphylococcus aureus]MCB8265855.1 RNA polymerase subunit sigma-70 [Staphylococcus aureus]MCB8273886.1 RNA polymerase subunit sigma-70 [Staphylococcus aureus]MCC5346025.1 LuxR C-terminal-related transcriptional regulator [Staphylococcus aureus]MRX26464.1 RNA polymerase subunit sigma-70 [Staphylococcus aureus]